MAGTSRVAYEVEGEAAVLLVRNPPLNAVSAEA